MSPLGLAEYLATSAEIAAVALIDLDQAASDPYTMVTVYEDWANQLAALNPPSDQQEYHAEWVKAVELQRDAGRELLESDDPQAALDGYIESMTEAASMLEGLGQTETELTLAVFNQREGSPEAEYFIARAQLAGEGEGISIFDELFASLAGIAEDPEGALRTIAELVDAVDPLMDKWVSLKPPSSIERLHNRQIVHWNEFVAVFSSLIEAFESNEPPPPTLSSQLRSLAQEAPLLNAEWALVTAATLRGENSSGLEGRWYRDNYGEGKEQLLCTGSTNPVRCRFLSHDLTDPNSTAIGAFGGSVAEPDSCPSHMTAACSEATFIAQGIMTIAPTVGNPIDVVETMAVQPGDSLILSWDDSPVRAFGFRCPWYRSYQTALDMDPTCYPNPRP